MARTPDKPGTYRIKPTLDGGFRLSGVDKSGKRVRQRYVHEFEAQSAADGIFGKKVLDDWGIPIVTDMRAAPETVANLNASLGIKTPTPGEPSTPPPDAAKKAASTKFAHSLMEMGGMAWATGTVVIGRKITDSSGKDPVNPNPKQVNQLADVTKETFVGWFGDRDIKPWQMMILLTIGIPLTMMLQSPPKKVADKSQQPRDPNLKSVP